MEIDEIHSKSIFVVANRAIFMVINFKFIFGSAFGRIRETGIARP